ncbi:MAG TPA: T9SS type A sorting domain-containing protein [Chitinophagaceae bacterium]|nr:T9SS type A sorting domain-containing protein [Chitinophagaceae bacterium]
MKTFLLCVAAIFIMATVKAQNFSENFDTATINSLTAHCWVLNGVSTTTQNGEAINGTSIYTAPPTSPGSKIDLYTPILNFSSTSTTISFDYRLTESLGGSATRSIQVSLVNLSGTVVTADIITMDAGNTTDVNQYQHTFSSITAGSYRVVLRVWGSFGNGNVRLVLDNYVVTNATLNNPSPGNCNFVAIVESTLPVQLKYFTAQLNSNKVDLKWVTSTEINTSHFVIEKSLDGINFSDAGTVFAFGNSTDEKNYNFTDNINVSQDAVIYYRLRTVDVDGRSGYSVTRIIRTGKQTGQAISILTYPNPVSNELRITLPDNWQNKKVTFEIFNANGQVSKRTESANSGQTETLNVSNLVRGFYFVRVSCEGQTAQQKIVKQ